MPGQRIGSLIAAAFGLVYVIVNSGKLSTALAWGLGAVALVVFVAIVARAVADRSRRPDAVVAAGDRPAPFGRGYWLIVLVEFVALFAGARVLSGPLDRGYAGVAWVSLVVGAHFFALAAHFRLRFFHVLGVLITACGAIGLVLAFTTGSEPAVAAVGGVVPGFVLLGFAVWGVGRPAGSSSENRPIGAPGT